MNDFATLLDPGTVRLERVLPGPIERVWAYLTEKEKSAQWFSRCEMEPRVGGRITFTFDHDQLSSERYPADALKHKGKTVSGTVVRFEPPRLLTYNWGDTEKDSEITYELTPQGKDVLLVLTHRNIQTRELLIGYTSGWDTHVGILADLLGGNTPRPFWTTHRKLVQEYGNRIPA